MKQIKSAIKHISFTIISMLILICCSVVTYAQTDIQTDVLKSIQNNILIPDSKKTLNASWSLSESLKQLKNKPSKESLRQSQKAFLQLMLSWKTVEALYTAGNLDEDMIDLPRYIDVFHSGNESIEKQLERSFKSQKKVRTLLFRNSTRSINALEYVLFSGANNDVIMRSMMDNNGQRIKIALAINHSITDNLEEIHRFYFQDKTFVQLGKQSIEDLVNVLIDSSYKLLTWRIAEPAGLGEKYRGKPDSKRLEYLLSDGYFQSVNSILSSYQKILDSQEYLELGNLGAAQGVKEEINIVRKHIKDSILKTQRLIEMREKGYPAEEIILSKNYLQLHRSLTRLHNSFYILLIEALGLKSKIIEADGD